MHVFGIMLLVMAPLPYVDATASWAFRNRYERALVGAVGVLSEVIRVELVETGESFHRRSSSLACCQ